MHDIFFQCRCGASFHAGQPKCDRVLLHTVSEMDAVQGFKPVIDDLGRLLRAYRNEGSRLAINITGGYKGAIPSLTSLCIAERLDCPLYYLHESQNAIVRVDFRPECGGLATETLVRPEDVA
jgi:CRISPR/Cas system-associated protein Csm6